MFPWKQVSVFPVFLSGLQTDVMGIETIKSDSKL